MKRLFAFLLFPLLLAGCAKQECVPPSPEAPTANVPSAYEFSAEIYDWFDLTTMPLD